MFRARQPPTRLVWLRLRYRLTRHDLVRTSVFLFTLIVLFSEEFLLHSLGHAISVRSFSYTPRAGLLRSFSSLLELVILRSFSYTPRADFSEEFLLHSSSWF